VAQVIGLTKTSVKKDASLRMSTRVTPPSAQAQPQISRSTALSIGPCGAGETITESSRFKST
jgi:hypothetical protein